MTTRIMRGDHAKVTITPKLGMPKTRTLYRLCGVSPNVQYAVHNNNLNNLRRGVMERVMFVEKDGELRPPPEPVKGVYRDRLAGFLQRLSSILPKSIPMSREEFADSYKDRRKAVYWAAVESLRTRPVTRQDADITPFVKAEKILLSSLKPDPAPRIIQPRDPRYNVEVGRYLKHLEHDIYACIASLFGGPTVMKGYNVVQVGGHMHQKWCRFRDPCAIGLDASRFDQHVSVDALKWEHGVYLRCFTGGDRNELARLLAWQLETRGVGRVPDGRVKYKVPGKRMSGDMNTALGNCLLMCALVWSYAHSLGVRVELANNGDDCTVFMERADEVRFREGLPCWFEEMGFTMKVEPTVYDLEHVEFCQMHPVCVDGTWTMVRDPSKCVAKDAHSILPLHQERMLRGWLTAIGECGGSLSPGVPLLQEFYSCLRRAGQGTRIGMHDGLKTGMLYLSRGLDMRTAPITPHTRYSFWLAFGILPDMQVAMEEYYSNLDVSLMARHEHLIDLICPDFRSGNAD